MEWQQQRASVFSSSQWFSEDTDLNWAKINYLVSNYQFNKANHVYIIVQDISKSTKHWKETKTDTAY